MNEFEESNKQHLKEMSVSGKLQYFKDYYLKIVLLAAAGIAIIIYMLYSFFKPQPVPVLRVVVFDNVAKEEELDALTEEMQDLLDAHDKLDEVRFQTDYSSESPQDMARLSVMASAKEVDAIAAPREVFEAFAAYGYFDPLSDYLDEAALQDLADRGLVIEAAGVDSSEEEGDALEEAAGTGEILPYGMLLSESDRWKNCMVDTNTDFAIGIMAGAVEPENAAELIRYLGSIE